MTTRNRNEGPLTDTGTRTSNLGPLTSAPVSNDLSLATPVSRVSNNAPLADGARINNSRPLTRA